ncbi:MAG TPA: hypothetical protein VG603_00510 [Chitinophagales bacterium]|nr:hypothetical protein [Chitinophagales bacterium]
MQSAAGITESTATRPRFVNRFWRIATSSLLFFICFAISYGMIQVVIGLLAMFLKYGADINYNTVYVIPRDYHYWSMARVLAVYLTAPLLWLFSGLVIFNHLRVNETREFKLRPFLFWLMICLVNLCLGHLFFSPLGIRSYAGVGFYQTFAIVGTWMGLNEVMMGVFSGISIILSVAFGVLIRDELLKHSFAAHRIKTSGGKTMVVAQLYFLPVILGAVPEIALCSRANIYPTMFVLLNFAFIGAGMLIKNFNDGSNIRCFKTDMLNHIPGAELLIAVTMWVVIWRFLR